LLVVLVEVTTVAVVELVVIGLASQLLVEGRLPNQKLVLY
jgi:hypothetical protein